MRTVYISPLSFDSLVAALESAHDFTGKNVQVYKFEDDGSAVVVGEIRFVREHAKQSENR